MLRNVISTFRYLCNRRLFPDRFPVVLFQKYFPILYHANIIGINRGT